MKRVLALLLLLASGAASGQDMGPPPVVETDSTLIAALELAQDLVVVSVREQDGRYVYDLDGGEETTAVVLANSLIVARSEIEQTVLFMLEPYRGIAATYTENAHLLTRDAPVRGIRTRDRTMSYYQPQVSAHRVRILVCTAPATGAFCSQWTEAEPLSGGEGLQIYVADDPQRGPVYTPPPPPTPTGGGRQKTTTDLSGEGE